MDACLWLVSKKDLNSSSAGLAYKGNMFHHISAGRHFAQVLYASTDSLMQTLIGVLLEMHAYFELYTSLRLLPQRN